MINHRNTIELDAGHVAIVLTDESVKVVTPETEQTEDGGHIVDTPQLQMAMAITFLVMSDKEWIMETMERFEEQINSIPKPPKH